MPRYFFHLISPEGYSRDEFGAEYPSVNEAWLDAHRAATDMSCDFLFQHVDPRAHHFEITDSDGRFLIDLPFSEIAGGGAAPCGLREQLKARMARGRELRSELQAEFARTRAALDATRLAVGRSQAQLTRAD